MRLVQAGERAAGFAWLRVEGIAVAPLGASPAVLSRDAFAGSPTR
jgi:hypothetical protein